MTDTTDTTETESTDATGPATTDQEPTDATATAPGDTPSPTADRSDAGLLGGRFDVVESVYWGGLAVAVIVVLVALRGFYVNATAAIELLVNPEYVPLFLAGFNLVVLLAGGVAISVLVRELAGETVPADGSGQAVEP